ncbi:hypothetical protein A3H03_02160 [Candidatus Kuenenbacteria bacterium RIFCSPLOWO2_12_FULL_42_13]|uniref:Uncharacterized protein n=4 Tax=Candidatus Kueneniibacteriota TaxID=1752740 RepID=A0A0G1BY36_9BACT|nr:MAG: hypothetical protein UV02_C0018G0002 [Candidatus Kuenenbacteria bacterium GW2011_GWA2_42_15]OGG89986.1 MAG: hypothetical protein A3C68_01170 [Candidatus Kuenenbacteria bacterium RIFCSPHIGHO2_02_FULL_42_29]OGG91520.1 MAG: hypothetical protein A3H03_02160 [Candidatus Kuenenbacteria bacterium RIFCSPLOWO2_12_FULL_42_13]OGG95731.1 MAG: hypothetical protein A2V95_03680 [Candidatus Kuenenbacteria bacterium RBG_16_41_7]OGG98564.1 MAG: hypothetical protein A3E04_03980 [Candidatus Kuenenbacteria 
MENITKQDIEKIVNGSTNVILEDLHGKFNAFGESLDYLKERVDGNIKETAQLGEGMTTLKIDIAFIKKEIVEIKEKLDQKIDRYEHEKLETRVTRLENYVKKYLVKV